MDHSWLWIPATLIAALTQTGRNAAQSGLTKTLGAIGAAHIRFLYALPFSIVFLTILLRVTGEELPDIHARFFLFVLVGSVAQAAATALMLWAMEKQSFSVVTAVIKTEPIQIALFAVLFFGEYFSPLVWIAFFVATCGVVIIAVHPGMLKSAQTTALAAGLAAGAGFSMTALSFQTAVRELAGHSAAVQASTTLVCSLIMQTVILMVLMILFDRASLIGSFKLWRSSFGVGFLGAVASQFWFIAFALTSAANVRTLGLVEVLIAYVISRRIMHQITSRKEIFGMVLIVLGVSLMIWGQSR